MRFDWEPRPVREGQKQIERNQRYEETVTQLKAQLDETAKYANKAHWENSSALKAMFVQRELENIHNQNTATIGTTIARPQERPCIVETIRQEESDRRQQLSDLKAAAAALKAEQLEEARQIALLKVKEHQKAAEQKTERLIDTEDVRSLDVRIKARCTLAGQQAQATEKHLRQVQQARADAAHGKEVKLRAQQHEAEIAAAKKQLHDARLQLASCLEAQLDLKEKFQGEAKYKELQQMAAMKVQWLQEGRQMAQNQENERETNRAKLEHTLTSNAWQQAKKNQQAEADAKFDAALLFQRLLNEKLDQARLGQSTSQKKAETDAYYTELEAALDTANQQNAEDEAKFIDTFYKEQGKRDALQASQEARRHNLQQEANEYNSTAAYEKSRAKIEQQCEVQVERETARMQAESERQAAFNAAATKKQAQEHLRVALDAQMTAAEVEAAKRKQKLMEDHQKLKLEEQKLRARVEAILSGMH